MSCPKYVCCTDCGRGAVGKIYDKEIINDCIYLHISWACGGHNHLIKWPPVDPVEEITEKEYALGLVIES